MCICRVLPPPLLTSCTARGWWQTEMVLFAIAALFFAVAFFAVAALQSCQCHCCCFLPAVTAIVVGWLLLHFYLLYSLLLQSHCHCYCCCRHPFSASYAMALPTPLLLLLAFINAIIIAASWCLHRCWSTVDCCFFSNKFVICYCGRCSLPSSAATSPLAFAIATFTACYAEGITVLPTHCSYHLLLPSQSCAADWLLLLVACCSCSCLRQNHCLCWLRHDLAEPLLLLLSLQSPQVDC